MNSTEPLVSFVIVSYNEPYSLFRESLYSIVNQDYSNIEIIHINNGSVYFDFTEEMFSYEHVIYKYFASTDLSFTKALNLGVRQASGKFIFRQDPDDYSHLNRVRKTLEYFSLFDCDFISTSSRIINEQGAKLGVKVLNSNKYLTLDDLVHSNPLVHGSLSFKKKSVELLGGYNESFINSQDYELYTYSLKKGLKIYLVPDLLYYLRIRVGSVSSLHSTSLRQTLFSNFIKHNVVLSKADERTQFDKNILEMYYIENSKIDRTLFRKKMYSLSANGYFIDVCKNFRIRFLFLWIRAFIISLNPKYFYGWFY